MAPKLQICNRKFAHKNGKTLEIKTIVQEFSYSATYGTIINR